jgi:hypothetical protein
VPGLPVFPMGNICHNYYGNMYTIVHQCENEPFLENIGDICPCGGFNKTCKFTTY